jgi:hypothetical protein
MRLGTPKYRNTVLDNLPHERSPWLRRRVRMLYQAASINGQPMLISVNKHTKSYEADFPNINQSDNKAGRQGGEGLNDTKYKV